MPNATARGQTANRISNNKSSAVKKYKMYLATASIRHNFSTVLTMCNTIWTDLSTKVQQPRNVRCILQPLAFDIIFQRFWHCAPFFPRFFQAASSKREKSRQKLHCQEFCWSENTERIRDLSILWIPWKRSIKSKGRYKGSLTKFFSPDIRVDLKSGNRGLDSNSDIRLFQKFSKQATRRNSPVFKSTLSTEKL